MASGIILVIAYASYISGMALSRKILPNAHILVVLYR